LIKCLLMFRNHEFPPHPMTGILNLKFSLKDQNIYIASSPRSLGNGVDEPARVLINNFNATGGNTAIIVEGPPTLRFESKKPRFHHIVTVSAGTCWSLGQKKKRAIITISPATPFRKLSRFSLHNNCPQNAPRFPKSLYGLYIKRID